MNFVKADGIQIVLDVAKALLLNDYLKKGYIKLVDKKGNFEILSDNPIVRQSIMSA